MFGKRILSIVGLLFLGSQFSTVSAECDTWTSVNEGTYTIAAGCTLNGYYVAYEENDNGASGKVLNVDTNRSDKIGVLIQVDSETSTTARVVEDVGYFLSPDGKYISNDYQGHAKLLSDVEGCTDDNIGKLVIINDGQERRKRGITYQVCLGSKSDGTFASVSFSGSDSNKYLLTLDKVQLFSDSDTTGGVISVAEKSITWDNDNDDKDFCVDTDTKVISNRPSEYCNGNESDNCGSYYSCKNGICSNTSTAKKRTEGCDIEDSGTYSKCGKGYYIKTDKTLMYCTGSGCGPKPTVIGYLVNNGDADKYIKCVASGTKSGSYEGNSCDNIEITGLKQTCTDGDAGLGALIKDVSNNIQICNTATTGVNVVASDGTKTTGQYFIDGNVADKTFTKKAQGEDALVMIDIADGNIILNTKVGNFIYDDSTKALQATASSDQKDLYVCSLTADGYSVCGKDTTTIGYLTNAGDSDIPAVPYIKCVADTVGNKCTAIDSITSTEECAKEGDIIVDQGDYKICSYATAGAASLSKVDLTGPAHFLVDASATSIFVQTKPSDEAKAFYVIVNVKGGDITLNKDVKKYRYTIGSHVYFKGENGARVCKDTTSINTGVSEYVLTKDEGDKDDYYKLESTVA